MGRHVEQRTELTNAKIGDMEPREKMYRVYDSKIPSLVICVSKSTKSFGVYLRHGGELHCQKICRWNPIIDVEEVRKKAIAIVNRIMVHGDNPKDIRSQDALFSDVWDSYLKH